MAGHFVSSLSGSPQAGGTSSASSSSSASANRTVGAVGMAQIGGFDFHTSTGILRDEHPWAAIQEVNYQLMPAADRSRPGNDLVRTVNRNLLAVATQTPETERLIGDIEYVEFAFYDGMQWRDTWDSSAGDNGLPSAVRVRIQPATTNKTNIRLEPMEMIVVIQTQGAATNSTATASAQ